MSEAELQVPDEIRGVLIPLQQGQLLLPNAAVAEVIDYRQPDPVADAPDWLVGSTNWRQRNLAVVRLESLLGWPVGSEGVRQRIVVCHALNDQAKRPFIGILATAIPRLVRVREGMLESQPVSDAEAEGPVHARVLVDGQAALIPDLMALEQRISALA